MPRQFQSCGLFQISELHLYAFVISYVPAVRVGFFTVSFRQTYLSSSVYTACAQFFDSGATKDNVMQQSAGVSLRKFLAFLFLSLSLAAVNAHASEGGGGEGGGGAYTKLEPFTVNLVGLTQVIQLVVTLKMAKPEAGEKVKLYMPAVRHNMILLLSSKSADQVSSAAGKQKLIKETISAVNRAIESNAKEGVADALFESIIIQ